MIDLLLLNSSICYPCTMALKVSVSGVRGTLGSSKDITGDFTPDVLVGFVNGYAKFIKARHSALKGSAGVRPKVVIGRDGRISGPVVSQFVAATLQFNGIDVIDVDLSTTPTVEMAVVRHKAQGGIVLSASHNPENWNALKLLNEKGEFISAAAGDAIKESYESRDFTFPNSSGLGTYKRSHDDIQYHIQETLNLPLVNVEAIKAAGFHVVVDCINSTGSISIPPLLDELGVTYDLLFDDCSGKFAHVAEPLPKNLGVLAKAVATSNADLGIAVDPDVDRLVLISEDGRMFGEEYTLVAVADYILSHKPGPVVSNLSSSRALKDVADRYNQPYAAGAVGEVNVVNKMREIGAVLGGEGNGGIIYPTLHYGRDSIVGIALMLSHLAESGKKASEIRASYPNYTIVKESLPLPDPSVERKVLDYVTKAYAAEEVDLTDGVKVNMADGWVHLRASNTEPIIRVIAESHDEASAKTLAAKAMKVMKEALK